VDAVEADPVDQRIGVEEFRPVSGESRLFQSYPGAVPARGPASPAFPDGVCGAASMRRSVSLLFLKKYYNGFIPCNNLNLMQ
jgi:hypothetical protein